MGSIEERLAVIRRTWEKGWCITDGDIGWLIGQLEAALKREAEYKAVLERLMAGVK